MTYLYSADESRAIDATAINQMGIPGFTLMQRAAQFAWDQLLMNFPGVDGLTVWCGKGNNAGDAYLVAALAAGYGVPVTVLAVAPTDELRGDAATAYQQAVAGGVEVRSWTEGDPVPHAQVHVDGLLGTGVRGAPRDHFAAAIRALNEQDGAVLSIDLPSGVNASTGAVAGPAVHADLVTTFITHKVWAFTGAGLDYCQSLSFSDLGVAPSCYPPSTVQAVSFDELQNGHPQLSVNTYKHRQGHVVVCGGDQSMPGAVALASRAALRTGAGMVTCVTQPEHRNAIVSGTPEVMVATFDELEQREADLFVLGPGLGRSSWSEQVYKTVEAVSGNNTTPVVLDADGLYWLAQHGAWAGGPLSITPHIAEAARLLNSLGEGVSARDVQHDRLQSAKSLRSGFNCQGVLKGAGSVVFGTPNSSTDTVICLDGNPGMASAGMGDVLSGVAGAVLGQSLQDQSVTYHQALVFAVCLHSAAADLAARHYGEVSLIASDVIDALPRLLGGATHD